MSKIKNNIKDTFSSKNINNILMYGSCFSIFLLSVFYIPDTFFPYVSPRTFLLNGLVAILSAFWIYAIIVDKSFRLSKKFFFYLTPLLLFVFWISISGITAYNSSLSFWSSVGRGTGLVSVYHSLMFALIVASLIKKNGIDFLHKLMFYFALGGFLLALSVSFGLQGLYILRSMPDTSGGFMGNSSLTAGYLFFPIAFALFLLFAKNYVGKKWWIGVMLAGMILSPLYVNILGYFFAEGNLGLFGVARGATLGLIVAVCVAFVLYLSFSKKKIVRYIGIAGIVIGLSTFSIGWNQLITPDTYLHNKFIASASGTRFVFSEVGQRSMDKHPWLGYGHENYAVAFQDNLDPRMAMPEYGYEVWSDRAHNLYYDIGVGSGYPAIVFYTLFIISIIYGLYKLKNSEKINHIQLGALGGIVIGYIFQMLFVFDANLSLLGIYTLATIVFVSIDGLGESKCENIKINSFQKEGLPILIGILCIVSIYLFSVRPYSKVSDYYRVAQMPMNLRGAHYHELIGGSSVGEAWDVSEIVSHIYKLYNQDPMKIKSDPALLSYAKEDIKGLLAYAEEIAKTNKTDMRLYTSIASMYNTSNFLNDNPYSPEIGDRMFKIYDHMKIISPYNPVTYWLMAQTYIWKQDYAGVVDSYKKAIAIDETIPESYRLLLNFAKATNNQSLYDQTLSEAKAKVKDFKVQ